MLGKFFALLVDIVIAVLIYSVIIWLLGTIIVIPAVILVLIKVLLVVYVIGAFLGFRPYSYPWL